jgi:hypothetical protein
MGVYALPEEWKSKLDDPSESLFQYEVEAAGVKVRRSKVLLKEQTEEEKAEELAKNPKAAKAAPAKGKNVKEEEPNAEELAKIASEKAELMESQAKLKLEWEALSEEERFQRTNEDIFKEPCVKFSNQVMINEVDKLKEKLAALGDAEETTDERSTL